MPADCEINDCGVLAVGRCHGCGKAFCPTHQAYGSDGPLVDLCQPCQQARDARKEEAARQRQERAGQAYGELRAAVQALDVRGAARPQKPEKVHHATMGRKTIFGNYRQVEAPEKHVYGWPVGEYEWKLDPALDGSLQDATFMSQTYVTPDCALVTLIRSEPQFCRDLQFGLVAPAPVGLHSRRAEFLTEIAGKLRKLA